MPKPINAKDELYNKVFRWAMSPRRINTPLWQILGHRSEKAVKAFAIDNQQEICIYRTSKYHEENEK